MTSATKPLSVSLKCKSTLTVKKCLMTMKITKKEANVNAETTIDKDVVVVKTIAEVPAVALITKTLVEVVKVVAVANATTDVALLEKTTVLLTTTKKVEPWKIEKGDPSVNPISSSKTPVTLTTTI